MVSALDSGASSPGLSPGCMVTLCCVLGQDAFKRGTVRVKTLTVPLSTQEYKWVPRIVGKT